MISVVICHKNPNLLNSNIKSIDSTIGVPYELVIIDNKSNKYNIFQSYNLGIKKCKYDLICFIHEDLIFHTDGWGLKVINHFFDAHTGIIGIAGGTAFPACPSPWWNKATLNKTYSNILQHHTGEKISNYSENLDHEITHDYINPDNLEKVQVVTLDGVWLCAHRRVFEKCKFDDITFTGFDNYDLDICFQAGQYFNLYVVFDILVEHLSPGKYSNEWIDSLELLTRKWRNHLPIILSGASENQISKFNNQSLLFFSDFLYSLGTSDSEIRKKIFKYFSRKPIRLNDPNFLYLLTWEFAGKKACDRTRNIIKKISTVLI